MAIKRELPLMGLKKYFASHHDKHFLNNIIKVCEECYFLLNDINSMTKSDINVKIKQTQLQNKLVN